MPINIGSLINERRNGFATLAYEDGEEVREQRIRISFLKPTSQVWRDIQEIEKDSSEEKDALAKAVELISDEASEDEPEWPELIM